MFGISKFKTKNNFIFYECSSLISLELKNFDIENIDDLYSMFNLCYLLN